PPAPPPPRTPGEECPAAPCRAPTHTTRSQPPTHHMNPVATPADLTRSDARATAADLSVAVVGMGCVGLPNSIALAAAGHPVIGLDISERRLATIAAGDAELLDHEQDQLAEQLGGDSLALTADPAELAAADAVIIAV